MKIFLDFDNTLIHTRRIANEVYKPFLIEQGKTIQEIEDTFSTFSSGVDPSREVFTLESHVHKLKFSPEEEKIILPQVQKIFRELEDFLFPGVIEFLKSIANHQLILLTFGDHDFQKMKIEAAGIIPFFSSICITQEDKLDKICKQIDAHEKVVFIDDHGEYFGAMKKALDDRFFGIHFLHPHTKHACDNCEADFHTGDFSEVTRFIQNICVA